MHGNIFLAEDKPFEINFLERGFHHETSNDDEIPFLLRMFFKYFPDFLFNRFQRLSVAGALFNSLAEIYVVVMLGLGFFVKKILDSLGPEVLLKLISSDLATKLLAFAADRDREGLLI